METTQVKLTQVKINNENPRSITTDKFNKLVNSLLVFPKMLSIRPVVVDKQKVALGGNMRLQALKEIAKMSVQDIAVRLTEIADYATKTEAEKQIILSHWEQWLSNPTVEIVDASNLSEDEKKQFIIKDNVSFGNWDYDALANSWDNLSLQDWGMDVWNNMPTMGEENENDSNEDSKELKEDDFDANTNIIQRCSLGDVWQMGEHLLLCGDSTNPLDINKLMDNQKADLVFTDPPYGMGKENVGVLNDNLNFNDLLEFNKKWIPLTFETLKDNGSWYCWGIDEPLMDIYSNILKPMIKQNRITFRNLITWDKGSGQGQMSEGFRMYPIADEKCLFVMMGVQGFNTNADNYFEGWEPIRSYLENEKNKMGWNEKDITEITGVTTCARHYFNKSQWEFPTETHYKALQAAAKGNGFKREYDEIKREYYATRAYFNNVHDNMNNVWHFGKTTPEERKECGGHATPKPLALCGRAIKSSSREGDIVLDVFGGSGSTLIACEHLNRKCRIIELTPKYCDVIIQRWENFTGGKAKKIN